VEPAIPGDPRPGPSDLRRPGSFGSVAALQLAGARADANYVRHGAQESGGGSGGSVSATRDRHRRPVGRLATGAFLLAGAGLLTLAGVYAGLSATATGAGSTSTGTLNLTLGPDAGVGLSTFVGPMAPGDTDNVFVDVDNVGTLATAAGMTVQVTGAPANALVDGSVPGEGLTATLTQCSVAWTLATGACTGTTTPLLATTPVHSLAAAVALANVPSLAAATGQVAHVRVQVGLAATEVSVDGVAPAASVQGLSTTLGFAFVVQQRTGVATGQ